MSEKDLDLEALAEAFQQLQLAAGSLASALQPTASPSQNDGWELVQAEPRVPADILPAGAQDPPSGSSSGPRPFRFRPSPKPLASPQVPSECVQLCVSLAPSVQPGLGRQVFRQGVFSEESKRWSSPPQRSRSRIGATWFSGTLPVPLRASTGIFLISRRPLAHSGQALSVTGGPLRPRLACTPGVQGRLSQRPNHGSFRARLGLCRPYRSLHGEGSRCGCSPRPLGSCSVYPGAPAPRWLLAGFAHRLRASGAEPDAQGMHGPSTTLEVPAAEEDEVGGERLLDGESLSVLLVDLDESAAAYLEPYDQDAGFQVVPFDPVHPDRFPDVTSPVPGAVPWHTSEPPSTRRPKRRRGCISPLSWKHKRVTTGQLQGQLASLLEVMPRLTGLVEDSLQSARRLGEKDRPAQRTGPRDLGVCFWRLGEAWLPGRSLWLVALFLWRRGRGACRLRPPCHDGVGLLEVC